MEGLLSVQCSEYKLAALLPRPREIPQVLPNWQIVVRSRMTTTTSGRGSMTTRRRRTRVSSLPRRGSTSVSTAVRWEGREVGREREGAPHSRPRRRAPRSSCLGTFTVTCLRHCPKSKEGSVMQLELPQVTPETVDQTFY